MWVAVMVFCASMTIDTCQLFSLKQGYETREQCLEEVNKVGSKAEELGILGKGNCTYVEGKGEQV